MLYDAIGLILPIALINNQSLNNSSSCLRNNQRSNYREINHYELNRGKFRLSTSNRMFGRKIWDKFSKITTDFYTKHRPSQTFGSWLIATNQKTLSIEANIL